MHISNPLKTGLLPPTLPRENTGRQNLEEWVLEGCFGRWGWDGAWMILTWLFNLDLRMTGIGFFVKSDGMNEENGIKVPLKNSPWARSNSDDLGEVLVILEPEN